MIPFQVPGVSLTSLHTDSLLLLLFSTSDYMSSKRDREVRVFSIVQNCGKSTWFSGLLWTKLMENSWPVGKTMNVFPVECFSLYVYRHMYEHVHICMYAYTQIHNHTYVCMYTCIHTNTYTCMCTYSHTHTPLPQFHLYCFLSDFVRPLTLIFSSLLTTVLFSFP